MDGANGTLTDEFLNGLVQGGSWTFGGGQPVLTFSFSLNDTLVSPWTPALQNAFVQALAGWSNVTNISFAESGSGGVFTQSTADLAVTLTGDELYPAVGFGIFPDPNVVDLILYDAESSYNRDNYPRPEGDLFFADYYAGFSSLHAGGYGLEIMVHEIGHALGLKHPNDDGASVRPTFSQLGISGYDTGRWTVMSTNETSFALDSGQVASPMPLDILAIQQIYGANMAYHAGDDVYSLVSNINNPYQTIWDAGGIDTFDASGYAQGVTIDLSPGTGYAQGASAGDGFTAIAFNVTIENAVGSVFNDTLTGNDATNDLWGGDGNDSIVGGDGNDTAQGNAGDDFVRGALGNDDVRGGQGNDTVQGGQGLDVVRGGFGNDELRGGLDADQMFGGQNNDTLFGGQGNDTLQGLAHDDVLQGLAGNDLLTGGPGLDQFWFNSDGAANADSVTDFDVGGESDTLVLQAVFFTLLAPGALGASSFVSGTGAAAADGDDYILYDTATGNLSYDADGDGTGTALLVATLTGPPALTAGDFLIVA